MSNHLKPAVLAVSWLLASLAGGCADSDDSPPTEAATCEAGDAPPTCYPQCGSDVVAARVCDDGVWSSPAQCRDTPCPTSSQPSCEMYNREVCCGAAGAVVFARCPTPSQPICDDGTAPQASCAAVRMTLDADNLTCGDPEGVFFGVMTLNIAITNDTDAAVTLDELTSGGESMSFESAEVAAGATARFKCLKSPSASTGDWPRDVTATLKLEGGDTVDASGEAVLIQAFDNCNTVGSPDFACDLVTEL